ncbi:MAG: FkbM family methyltransferase [Spirochaetales bacterium]|nr:FkbM family methyltransferase [Spirochaetales bacterium]
MSDFQLIQKIDGISVYGPQQARAIIGQIWEEECYTSVYHVRKDDVVIDIGANIGIFTLYALAKGAYVYAIEPNPAAFEILQRNIAENNFTDNARLFGFAISDSNGFADLQIPASEKIYSLGSTTISNEIKSDMEKRQEIEFRSLRVETVSINSFLEKHVQEDKQTDFLKMDCEGAEFPILESLDKEHAKRINHIVMETHMGYDESRIVGILNGNGFTVDKIAKRSGYYQTGYCHAGRDNPAGTGSRKPVAVMEACNYCSVNEEISLSAGKSFVTNSVGEKLRVSWEINGSREKDEQKTLLAHFPLPGAYRVRCTVSNDSGEDSIEKKITVFEKDYFMQKADEYLDKDGKRQTIQINTKKIFGIKKEDLSGEWETDKIVISINADDVHAEGFRGSLTANGMKAEFSNEYTEIEIDAFCPSADLLFSVQTSAAAAFRMAWWAKHGGCKSDNDLPEMIDGIYYLKDSGADACIITDSETRFRIRKDKLPAEWTPKILKIGTAPLPLGDINEMLDGYLYFNGEKHELSDWYTETAINPASLKNDIDFRIRLMHRARLKIVWWAE